MDWSDCSFLSKPAPDLISFSLSLVPAYETCPPFLFPDQKILKFGSPFTEKIL